ncbi:bacillithiol biosynthesis cysteine-adding enzyme BshC [Viridibacillus sp. FSL H8-0110]|uniref:bacillithiol biosynthesis cysteine-adding enzyme BshC n=1 Tax=Viridibacillus sp. FSL H8-0110 TaxID=2921376 RepID=UPI0030FBF58B
MKLEQIDVPVNNQLLVDYRNQKSTISSFFHYTNEDESFERRLEDLKNHPIRRAELVKVISEFMAPLEKSVKMEQHLRELENNAVVVVGGQQAGLLTGPLYSVHKAISVLLLAKEQRAKLDVPVVPVFWIAGEDHDIDEINHTFTALNGRLQKHIHPDRSKKKTMASTTTLDIEDTRKFIKNVFQQYGETAYTEELLAKIDTLLVRSHTYTDFFAQLMHWLFKEEGLLLLDAADPKLRAYEAPYFERLVNHSEEIADVVSNREALLADSGYGTPIGATKENANLFYVKEGERFLLERKDGKFINNVANVQFTKEDMLQLAIEQPACLSNNVVTRPLMQDMVLPVLAFVGGPGELAYWSTLKDAFELLGMKVPVFVPRMNMTLVNRQVSHLLETHDLSVTEVLSGKVAQMHHTFVNEVYDDAAKEAIEKTKALLQQQYVDLQKHLHKNDVHLDKLVIKNLDIHENQLDFLLKKIEAEVLLQHDVAIRRFNEMEGQLIPEGILMERVFNPFRYMNEYGMTLIGDILQLPLEVSELHQVIYI